MTPFNKATSIENVKCMENDQVVSAQKFCLNFVFSTISRVILP